MRASSLMVACAFIGACTIELPTPDLDLGLPSLSVDPGAPGGLPGILPPHDGAPSPSVDAPEDPADEPLAGDEPPAGGGPVGDEPPAGDDPPAVDDPPAGGGSGVEEPDDTPPDPRTSGPAQCLDDSDCWGGTCHDGGCHAPACDDGVANQGETAPDCGGPCAPCPADAACTADADCALGECRDGACCEIGPCGDCATDCCVPDCAPGQCGHDGCGGSCGGCALGDGCFESGVCSRVWGCPWLYKTAELPCDVPEASFGHAFRVTSLYLPPSGKKGHGFDLDPSGDPSECSPASNCASGIDNAAAPVGIALNKGFSSALESGDWVWLGERLGEQLRFHVGAAAGACKEEVCSYYSSRTSWNCGCEVISTLDVTNDLLAGSSESPLLVPLRLGDGFDILVPLREVRIVVVEGESFDSSLAKGLIGGAIRRDELLEAIAGSGKPWLLSALSLLGIEADTDTDGDLVDDAISIGLQFEAEPARIIGMTWQ